MFGSSVCWFEMMIIRSGFSFEVLLKSFGLWLVLRYPLKLILLMQDYKDLLGILIGYNTLCSLLSLVEQGCDSYRLAR